MAFSARTFDYSSRKVIPCVVMDGPPNEKTHGGIGVLYMDKRNGSLYKCVAENFYDNLFAWEIVGEVSDDMIQQSVSDFLTQNPVSGGLSDAEKDMLLTLFRGAVYQDQFASETAEAYIRLTNLWGSEAGDDSHTHSYTGEVTTAANCTTAGVKTFTCQCGDAYTEEIPATGHTYVEGVCSVCGAADPAYNPDVTLTDISAVYSGGDVAVGTAVADLVGIVVTAHYSDGSSEPVTGYTLSGTIAEGSNTVTVSYGGKTAIFTVTGVSESGGGDAGEAKTLSMTLHNEGTIGSLFYTGNADSEQLTAWDCWWYKSNAIADEDVVVNIAFAAGYTNAALKYYAAQIKQEDYKKFYYVEQLGTAITTETVKSYTVRAGYELVFLVSNSSEIATLNVTYTDGIFTDVTELYTNLVGGYTLNAYLNSSDGSITPNWTKQNTSDLIDVSAVDAVHIWSIANGYVMEQRNLTYCFYDESEKFISGGDAPGNADAITAVVVPDSAKYMRVGGGSSSTGDGVYVGINPAPYRYEFVAFA